MNPELLIDQYLPQGKVMQLATTTGRQPWICSVYYIALPGRQVYWLSWPSRRHSRELAQNSLVAAAIVLQSEQPVVGLQMEGRVTEVEDESEVAEVMEAYVARHHAGSRFLANFQAGTNQHVLYKLVPHQIVLFDEQHFPGHARKEAQFEGY